VIDFQKLNIGSTKRFHNIYYDTILILVIGLLSFSWFRGNYLIMSHDFIVPLQWHSSLPKILYSWDPFISLGVYAPRDIAFLTPTVAYLSITKSLGLSLVLAEKILFYIWFVSAGLSMYGLSYILKIDRIGRLASSFFYMMNPLTLYTIWKFSGGLYQPFYVYAPLILGMYIYGLQNGKGIKFIILFVFILLLTATSSYVNPVYAILQWMPVFLYFIYFISIEATNRELVKRCVIFSCALLFVWTLVNFYWILPTLIGMQSEAARMAAGVDISNLQSFEDNSMSVLGALRLVGYWGIEGSYKGDLYLTWGPVYSSNLFVFLELLVPFICFLPLLIKRKAVSSILYFAILSIFLVFLTKGPNPPVGYINVWILQNIPFADIALRNPLTKFGLLMPLGLAPLLGVGINDIFIFLRKKYLWLASANILIIFALLFVVLVFPLWTGDVINPGGNVIPSSRVEIPPYYVEAKEYLVMQNNEFRIFPLPMSKRYMAAYDWESGFVGADLSGRILSRPSISTNTGTMYYSPMLIGEETEKLTTNKCSWKILSLLNVKYVVFHKDIKWEYIKDHPWWFDTDSSKLESFLSNEPNIALSNSFGDLDFYKVSDSYFLPLIYTTPAQIVVPKLDEFLLTTESPTFMPGEQNIVVLEQNQGKIIPHFNSTTRPTIFFQKINPTKYEVKVENAHEPFWLTFSQSFHPGWQAYITTNPFNCNPIANYSSVNVTECQHKSMFFELGDLTRVFDRPIPEKNHFVVNSYANGWYIDPQALSTGDDFTITIYFKPQSYFYISLIVSGLTFIVCTSYLFWDWWKRFSKKKDVINE